MNKIIFIIFLWLISLSAQEWINQSIDLTINGQFDKAQNLIEQRMISGDTSLSAYFYYASVLNSKMTHYENQLDEEPFFDALNQVIDKGESLLEENQLSNNEEARIYFYVGSAYGYMGFYQGQTGQWFSALSNGERAHNFLNKSVELDSTVWDAYLGLGAYKYWVSTKIHWIPFVPDRRDDGIRLIEKAIENNAYSKFMAMHQLIYILLDYGRFDDAQIWAEKVIAAYPESTFMRWAHSHVYMKMKNLPKAIESYKTLLELIDNDEKVNVNHRRTCLVRLADMYARSDSCRQSLDIITELKNEIADMNSGKDDEAQRLIEEISERCKE